jgi:20S proteasome alpha/beta subunit
MKITIEPTHKGSGPEAHCTVTVEQPHDDMTLDDALDLVAAALKAFGYHSASVDEAIPPR